MTTIGSDSHWPMLTAYDWPKMPCVRFAEKLGDEAEAP